MLSPFALHYVEKHPAAAAAALETFDVAAMVEVLGALAPEAAAGVYGHLLPQHVSASLALLPPERAAAILECLDFALALRHLYPLAAERRSAIVQRMTPLARQGFVRALSFPPDSVGRAMRARVAAFRARDVVQRVLADLARDPDPLPLAFVIDDAGRPIGVMRVADLIGAAPTAAMVDLMSPCMPPLSALARLESLRDVVLARGHDYLPVVDANQRLIGVLAKMDWTREIARHDGEDDAPELISLWFSVASLFWQVGARMFGSSAAPGGGEHGDRA